jgi:RimJ/RimL family protein N-acetyltransferase
MRFSVSGCLTLEQTKEEIDSFITSYRKYGFGKWAVILKETNQLIGYCGIALEEIDSKQETELGYRLSENYWGHGLATEAARAALHYGFNKLELPDIIAVDRELSVWLS